METNISKIVDSINSVIQTNKLAEKDWIKVNNIPHEIGWVTLNVRCAHCGVLYTVEVEYKDYLTYIDPSNKTSIQQIFPYLSADKRELLLSATCDECWNKIFSPKEEPEPEPEFKSNNKYALFKLEFKHWRETNQKHVVDTVDWCDLKVGDKVSYINQYKIVFKGHEVLGFDSQEHKVYLDLDCYWYSVPIEQLIKE